MLLQSMLGSYSLYVNLISASILVAISISVLFSPRKWATLALLSSTLYLGQGQMLEVAGVTLFPTRILGVLALIRVLAKREFIFSECNVLDKSVILLYVFITIIQVIAADTIRVVVVARCTDALLCYFSFRGLVRDLNDIRWLLQSLAILLIPYVLCLGIESTTHRNPFFIVGGNSSVWFREGKLRCFGSFRHPSLLGSLGATFFPLFIGLAWDAKFRRRAILGAVLCLVIVGFSNSGGPLSALIAAILGWLLWPFRTRMQMFRRSLAAALILLALLMKAPIWYLIAKFSAVTGGSGWHRSYLMDVAFQHFDQWWLSGMPIEATRGWFPYMLVATGGSDITNEFIGFGLSAGIGALAISIIVICKGFSLIGRALNVIRAKKTDSEPDEELAWGLGVVLAVHTVNWLGITYFDQFYVIWFFHLAAISSCYQEMVKSTETSTILNPHEPEPQPT